MGNHTNTSQSHLTLKEEIRARDNSFRIFIDITYILYTSCFIYFSLAHSCTKIFMIFHTLDCGTNGTFQICAFGSNRYGGSLSYGGAKVA